MITPNNYVVSRAGGNETRMHGSPDFPVAAYESCYTDSYAALHWHLELEVILAVCGEMIVTVPGRQILISEGDAVFINSEVMHGIVNAHPGEPCLIHAAVFMPEFVSDGEEGIIWHKYIYPLINDKNRPYVFFSKESASSSVISYMNQFFKSMSEEHPGFEMAARNAISGVLMEVVSEKGLQTGAGDGIWQERIQSMVRFVHENYAYEIKIADIAGAASVSESECLRCFKSAFNISPVRYLVSFRLSRAADRLQYTDDPVAVVATSCGYNHMSYFTKSFKKNFGVLPKEYRRISRGNIK